MVMSASTVEFYFDTSATGGDYFTVEHPTKGVVQTAAYPVAGDIATDVSAYVMDVSVNRGRSRQFDEMQTGTATITLNNRARTFDPLNPASPYVGNIKPLKRVRIARDGIPIYVGKIDDWNYAYDPTGMSTASVSCIDALGDLSAIDMASWVATASQRSGTRILAVLDRTDVNYTANRSIDTGNSTLTNDTVDDGTNVLAYLQKVSATERGRLYASRAGVLTFDSRTAGANTTAIAFTDDGTGIPYQGVGVSYGTELLYNRTITASVGGATQTFTDTDSAAEYGIRTLTQTDLLFEDEAQTYALGAFLVGLYADPELRLSNLVVDLARLTQTQRESVASLDLGSVIAITYTPNRVGAAIEREAVIEGINHDITRATHTVSFALGDTTNRYVFTVEDPTYGVVEGPGVVAF